MVKGKSTDFLRLDVACIDQNNGRQKSSIVSNLEVQKETWGLGFEPRCQLSTERIKGQRWGVFRGQFCGFADMSRAWKFVHEALSILKLLGEKSPRQILLDTLFQTIKNESSVNDPDEPIWMVVRAKR